MRNDSDRKHMVIMDDGVQGVTRWFPTIIVFCVVGGFFALSWYAYHAGMESVKDEELLVVEADKTPLKEKPADPGGMQFPNQDKTIFDTFSGSKPATQNVERILPSPEEPMSKDMDTSETSTWINDKLAEAKPAVPAEQVLGRKKDTKAEKAEKDKTDHQVIPVDAPGQDESETYVAAKSKPAQALDNAVKASAARQESDQEEKELAALKAKQAEERARIEKEQAARKEEEAKEEAAQDAREAGEMAAAEKARAEKALLARAAEKAEQGEKATRTAAGAVVQLGAYRTEEEAGEAWDKMRLKHRDLSDKTPAIIRADLGSKGIYYRLRVTGLESAAAARDLCAALAAKGQACLLPVDR